MHNSASVLENETHKLPLDFDIKKNRSPNLCRTTKSYKIQLNKRTCKIVDFIVSVDYRVKLKENENLDKFIDLARELNNWGTRK